VSDLYVFVDNSNVWIQGKVIAGKKATPPLPSNALYRIDYGKLLLHVLDGRLMTKEPKLYGSEPPPNDSVWNMIRSQGFDVQVFRRNVFNKEKGVDMKMGLDIQRLIFTERQPGTVAIVAGDADFIPVIDELQQAGWTAEVWYWSSAARDLRDKCDRFEPLDGALYAIGFER
jgi:uncharacterized LabA/DUF88 family protein